MSLKNLFKDEDEADYTVEMFYKYSFAWLEVSDCILLVPGWQNSKGNISRNRICKRTRYSGI